MGKVSKGVQPAHLKGGSRKGKLNKTTASVKAALTEAFERRGGVPALLAWAAEEPTEFYKLWGKILPKEVEVTGPAGAPLQFFVFGGQKVGF